MDQHDRWTEMRLTAYKALLERLSKRYGISADDCNSIHYSIQDFKDHIYSGRDFPCEEDVK